MTGVEVVIAVAGCLVTVLVVAGMILITPSGQVPVHSEGTDPDGSTLSPTSVPEEAAATAAP